MNTALTAGFVIGAVLVAGAALNQESLVNLAQSVAGGAPAAEVATETGPASGEHAKEVAQVNESFGDDLGAYGEQTLVVPPPEEWVPKTAAPPAAAEPAGAASAATEQLPLGKPFSSREAAEAIAEKIAADTGLTVSTDELGFRQYQVVVATEDRAAAVAQLSDNYAWLLSP